MATQNDLQALLDGVITNPHAAKYFEEAIDHVSPFKNNPELKEQIKRFIDCLLKEKSPSDNAWWGKKPPTEFEKLQQGIAQDQIRNLKQSDLINNLPVNITLDSSGSFEINSSSPQQTYSISMLFNTWLALLSHEKAFIVKDNVIYLATKEGVPLVSKEGLSPNNTDNWVRASKEDMQEIQRALHNPITGFNAFVGHDISLEIPETSLSEIPPLPTTPAKEEEIPTLTVEQEPKEKPEEPDEKESEVPKNA